MCRNMDRYKYRGGFRGGSESLSELVDVEFFHPLLVFFQPLLPAFLVPQHLLGHHHFLSVFLGLVER